MKSPVALQRALRRVRSTYGEGAEAEKARLLEALSEQSLRTATLLSSCHDDLLFLLAFPGSAAVRARATEQLSRIARRVVALGAAERRALDNTGIAGSVARYAMAHPIAARLCRDDPAALELDWASVEDPERIDRLIALVLGDVERESFGVDMPARRWVALAQRRDAVSTLQWLLRAGGSLPAPKRRVFEAAWDEAEVPVRWRLNGSSRSVTLNRIVVRQPVFRTAFRRLLVPLARHAVQPLEASRSPARRWLRAVARSTR